MTYYEQKYLVKQRAENDVIQYGSIENAISSLKKELEEMESLWGQYSSDCLGHGITCTQLKIDWLERQTN